MPLSSKYLLKLVRPLPVAIGPPQGVVLHPNLCLRFVRQLAIQRSQVMPPFPKIPRRPRFLRQKGLQGDFRHHRDRHDKTGRESGYRSVGRLARALVRLPGIDRAPDKIEHTLRNPVRVRNAPMSAVFQPLMAARAQHRDSPGARDRPFTITRNRPVHPCGSVEPGRAQHDGVVNRSDSAQCTLLALGKR